MKITYFETKIIDNMPKNIYKVIAHRFTMGDSEDPDLYAAEPIYNWQQSDQGQFVMSKAVETPQWHRNINVDIYGYEYIIVAKLWEEDATYFTLKWC